MKDVVVYPQDNKKEESIYCKLIIEYVKEIINYFVPVIAHAFIICGIHGL